MKQRRVYTLCIIRHHSRILLGLKKRGFKAGYLNGYGGKVKNHEGIKACLKREVREEAGIAIDDPRQIGTITFDHPQETMEVHVFCVDHFSGHPIETKEMKPRWVSIHRIPYREMLGDAKYWLPCVLEKIPFTGEFVLDHHHQILNHKIITVGY